MSFLAVPTLQRLTHSLTHHSLNCPSLTQARMCGRGCPATRLLVPAVSWEDVAPLLSPARTPQDQEGLVEAGRLN